MALWRRMMKVTLALSLGPCLSACATLRGAQGSVPELRASGLVPVSTAMRNYLQPADADRGGLSRLAYREEIITLYLLAIEDRYDDFTAQLQSGDRGSGLLFDLVNLGLTGATALSPLNDIEDLATVTAVATGARSVIDRRLFFDRTLPALISAMDAERTAILAELARKRNLPIEQYSLGEAMGDLRRLVRAGNIYLAATRVTRLAEADRVQQQARLDAITTACSDISAEAAVLNQQFRQLVHDDAATRATRLQMAAEELGIQVSEQAPPTWSQIRDAFDTRLCDDAAKRSFLENLGARIEGNDDGGN